MDMTQQSLLPVTCSPPFDIYKRSGQRCHAGQGRCPWVHGSEERDVAAVAVTDQDLPRGICLRVILQQPTGERFRRSVALQVAVVSRPPKWHQLHIRQQPLQFFTEWGALMDPRL